MKTRKELLDELQRLEKVVRDANDDRCRVRGELYRLEWGFGPGDTVMYQGDLVVIEPLTSVNQEMFLGRYTSGSRELRKVIYDPAMVQTVEPKQ